MARHRGVEDITVLEAAELAGRTPETVRRWVWSGRLEARRDGNRLLVGRDDVVRLAHPGAGTDQTEMPLSLAQWAERVHTTLATGGVRGHSAADLVLVDRADRTERNASR